MQWPNFESVIRTVRLPDGYKYAQVRDADISELVRLIPKWYPDIGVGEESCHAREEFWRKEVQTVECSEDRKIVGFTLCAQGEFVGFVTLQKNPDALSAMGRLGAVAPDHRHAGIGKSTGAIMEAVARAMGVEVLIQIASLHSPYPTRTVEAWGYTLCGILAGHDRDKVGTQEKRVFEAYYIKLLVPDSRLEIPRAEHMTPAVRELWAHLFPEIELKP